MRIFVTGTGTNVGKTTVSKHLCRLLGAFYWKPIQTGEEKDSKMMFPETPIHPESYHFKTPLSPHIAAGLENKKIDFEKITAPDFSSLVIEGAGGVLVPLNEHYLMIDLIKKFDLPVILVSKSELGTINHTLLSLQALSECKVLGVVLCGKDSLNIHRHAIEFYGKTKVLDVMEDVNDFSITKNILKVIQ
jgi:dethiobiotin synthetase